MSAKSLAKKHATTFLITAWQCTYSNHWKNGNILNERGAITRIKETSSGSDHAGPTSETKPFLKQFGAVKLGRASAYG